MLGVAEQATVTADPGVVCAGVVAVGAGLPTPPVRTGHAAGRLAAGYLGVLRAAARRTTGHPVGGSCATDAKHRRFTDPVFEQNPYSFAVRAAAIDVAVGIQEHPTSRRTIGSCFASPVTSPASSTRPTGKPTIGPTTRTACRPRAMARGRRTEQRDVVARLDALRRRPRRSPANEPLSRAGASRF